MCVFLAPKYVFFFKRNFYDKKPRLSGSMLVVPWVGFTVYLNLPAEGDSQRRRKGSRNRPRKAACFVKNLCRKIWPPLQLKEYRNFTTITCCNPLNVYTLLPLVNLYIPHQFHISGFSTCDLRPMIPNSSQVLLELHLLHLLLPGTKKLAASFASRRWGSVKSWQTPTFSRNAHFVGKKQMILAKAKFWDKLQTHRVLSSWHLVSLVMVACFVWRAWELVRSSARFLGIDVP